jgi:urease accessory protein
MKRFTRLLKTDSADTSLTVLTTLTLPFDQRERSRLRVTLDNGEQAGLFLERGKVMCDGDLIQAESGELVRIQAADESVSTVVVEDDLLMARACYHLGNRHVPLQIEPGFIRYQHDHVLDDMLRGMGLQITVELVPFEPEAGAYDSIASGHTHGHHHHAHHEH